MGVRVSTSSASSFSIISLGTAGEEYSCKASKSICSTLFFGAEASNARSTSWARRVTVPGRPASFATSMP